MRHYQVNRPEETAMRRLLQANPLNPTGMILRLAWLQGLLRDEITNLTWEQVSFLDHQIELPDRNVPLCNEMDAYLRQMHDRWGSLSEYVVFSERYKKPMQPQAISRIARRALDSVGQTEVRLLDLRHDYVIRNLEEHGWSYVAHVTGIEVRALQAHFTPYVAAAQKTARQEPPQIDELKLWKLLQAEKDSSVGLAIWLTWQEGLSGGEIISLTWDQVDLGENVLRLPDRTVPLGNTVRRMLLDRQADRTLNEHVFLSSRAKKPVDLPRLSSLVRSALIRGGLDGVTLRDLLISGARTREETAIVEWIRRKGTISRGETMDLLGVTKVAAYNRLRRMADEKKLVRVGGKYYLSGTVVPPEEQSAAIRAYLEKEGFAYRQDVAEMLHIQSRQCTVILKRMVDQGELVQVRQRYYLKEA